jgi:hypothetical protein
LLRENRSQVEQDSPFGNASDHRRVTGAQARSQPIGIVPIESYTD